MDRQEYLDTARDNAVNTAFLLRQTELKLPTSGRRPLRLKRMKLLDEAARYHSELIEIDARHVVVNRPTHDDKNRMANLRDRVRAATRVKLAASALIALANEVLRVIEEVRSVGG